MERNKEMVNRELGWREDILASHRTKALVGSGIYLIYVQLWRF